MRVETAGFPRRERGAGSGALHSRDGTSRRPRDAPAPRAPATPAGRPEKPQGLTGTPSSSGRRFARGRSRRRRRGRRVARARHDITVDQRAGGALACGGGVRAAGSALAVRPRPSLLTRQSVRKPRTHLLSCETSSSFKPWRWVGAGLAWLWGRVAFSAQLFQSVFAANRRRGLPILA